MNSRTRDKRARISRECKERRQLEEDAHLLKILRLPPIGPYAFMEQKVGYEVPHDPMPRPEGKPKKPASVRPRNPHKPTKGHWEDFGKKSYYVFNLEPKKVKVKAEKIESSPKPKKVRAPRVKAVVFAEPGRYTGKKPIDSHPLRKAITDFTGL